MMRFISTWFGVGLMKPAPGTWGSFAALPFAWALHVIGGFPLLVVATIAVFFLGWWTTHGATLGAENHDPSEIVIDEIVGQWIALWPVSLGAMMSKSDFLTLWPGILTAFVAFRLFDITKPGPVGWADRRHDALGVMLDDVIAGIMAAIVVGAAAFLAHKVLM